MTLKPLRTRTILAAYCFSLVACFSHRTVDEHGDSEAGSELHGNGDGDARNGDQDGELPSEQDDARSADAETDDDSEHPTGDNPLPTIWGSDIDIHVLARSLDMIDSLEIRRGDSKLVQLSYSFFHEHRPPATTVLSDKAFVAHWEHTLAGRLIGSSQTELADARAILGGLASYFVGVDQISIGPRCSPISSGYVYGFVKAGVPGDSARESIASEVVRSDDEWRRTEMEFDTHCFTDFKSNSVVGTSVIIRLPKDVTKPLTDDDVWQEQAGQRKRVGVPTPSASKAKKWHDGIDALLLAQAIDHLDEIEIRRGERVLATKPGSLLQEYVPLPGPGMMLTRESFLTHWRGTLWAWLDQSSNSAFEDAEAVLHALTRYAVGARKLTIAPSCFPLSGSYRAGSVEAGLLGDGAPASVREGIKRSDAAGMELEGELDTQCTTVLSADPAFGGAKVVLRLPAGGSTITDLDIWDAGRGGDVRVGVPLF